MTPPQAKGETYEVIRDETGTPQWAVGVVHGPYVSYHYTEDAAHVLCDMLNKHAAETARLSDALKDGARLQWLIDYITAKGANGLVDLEWSVYDEDGKSLNAEKLVSEDEVAEIKFDRAAIDRALTQPAPAMEKKE